MRAGLLLAGCIVAGAAQADIYTWRDASGAKRMSNVPPPWYSESEPGRPRTQVIVNGHLVDDTGLSAEARTRLQGNRARAQSWGKGTPPPPATAAAAYAPVAAPPAQVAGAVPGKPPAAPPAGVTAQSLEGLKRALEAQNLADKLAEELRASNRPR